MLKISALPIITQTIVFPFQDEDGTQPSIEVVFRILPLKAGKEADLDTDEQQRAHLRNSIVGIYGLINEVGQAVIDHGLILDQLIDRIEIRTALFRSYFKAREEAARGN